MIKNLVVKKKQFICFQENHNFSAQVLGKCAAKSGILARSKPKNWPRNPGGTDCFAVRCLDMLVLGCMSMYPIGPAL